MNEIDLNKERSKINRKQNITNEERQAIKDLAKNKDITIKPADKGGAIVILNTTDYIKEAERQLSDKATYPTTDTDLTTKHQDIVNDTLEDMVHNGDITQKMANLLKSNVPRTPQIYFLPKIHKDIVPPPGRPIVSANGCPTEKISAFVDHFLNPIVKKMNTYIEDTSDFLRNIENLDEIKPNSIIGTMDVSSLYTNIPNEEGISCIKELLNEKRNRLEKPSNDSLTKLLRLVLTKNNFQFNGTNYIQIGGTAMGTRVAPSLANLFMNSLENKMIQSYDKKPKVWLRYIDDIFYIWEHGEDELTKWLEHLNNFHKTIKFTNEWSHTKINFLDTTVKVNIDNKLYTDLYVKPTDTNSYLNYNSAHPPNCKNSLPYSQFLRIKRICTKDSDYLKNIEKKTNEFKAKNYPMEILDAALTKVEKLKRQELIQKKNKVSEDQNKVKNETYLTCTFLLLPKSTENCKKELGHFSPISHNKRYKRPKNLHDVLIRAKTDYHLENQKTNDKKSQKCCENKNKCKKHNCKYCTKLDKTGNIKTTDNILNCKKDITCNSSNVIYCIECKRCNLKYVGQTKRRIKDRIREHFYSINHKKGSDIAYHFNQKDHSGIHDIKIYIVDFIFKHPDSKRAGILRNKIEFNWIHRLHSSAPTGMNVLGAFH